MKKRAQKVETKKCPIGDCWELIPVRKHLCSACTSWWHRIQIKDENELAGYLQRLDRFAGRSRRLHRGR